MSACSTLLRYLTDTSISWLQKEFVEIDDPFASTVSILLFYCSIKNCVFDFDFTLFRLHFPYKRIQYQYFI